MKTHFKHRLGFEIRSPGRMFGKERPPQEAAAYLRQCIAQLCATKAQNRVRTDINASFAIRPWNLRKKGTLSHCRDHCKAEKHYTP